MANGKDIARRPLGVISGGSRGVGGRGRSPGEAPVFAGGGRPCDGAAGSRGSRCPSRNGGTAQTIVVGRDLVG